MPRVLARLIGIAAGHRDDLASLAMGTEPSAASPGATGNTVAAQARSLAALAAESE